MIKDLVAPHLPQGKTMTFVLKGEVKTGEVYVEPTIIPTPAGAGTVVLQKPVTAAADATGATAYQVAGTFKPAPDFLGPVALSATVQGNSQDALFYVLVVEDRNMVFDPTQFSVG